MEHWLPLDAHLPRCLPHDTAAASASAEFVSCMPATSHKRPVDCTSDGSSESLSPAPKTPKNTSSWSEAVPPSSLPPLPTSPRQPSLARELSSASPAFAPRADYLKLAFQGSPSVDTKIRWLTEVNRTFHLDRHLAEVKMAAAQSRFVYISRRRQDIVDRAVKGEFLSLCLEVQDSPERPRKYPSYFLTRYPIGVEPSLAKQLHGVHSARRFLQNGVPLNRLVVTWSLLDPPPPTVAFDFLPCLPACELRRLKDDQPWCFRCWGVGHISRYCSAASGKCAWCAADHDSRTCPHRAPRPPPPTSTSAAEQHAPPPPDTSHWKCPRCHQQGVNVWHGCARKVKPVAPPLAPPRRTTSQQLPHAARPIGSPAVSQPASESAQDLALREAVNTMMSRCSTFASRFDAIEARFDAMEAKFSGFVEAQQAVVTTLTVLTEKMDVLATRLGKLSHLYEESSVLASSAARSQHRDARPSHSSSPGSRKTTSKVR